VIKIDKWCFSWFTNLKVKVNFIIIIFMVKFYYYYIYGMIKLNCKVQLKM